MAIEVKERILVVEDEAIVLLDLKNRLNTLGYVIVGSSSYGEDAIKKAEETRPDIVLMDIGLKGKIDGVEAADQIRKLFNIPIIYLTANSDFNTLQRAKVTEPFGYILKPFDERELRTTIEMALYKHRLDIKLNETRRWMETTLNSIADAVITTDVGAHITFMNPAAEAMTGWKSADAMNRDIQEVLNIVEENTRTPVTGQVESVLQRNSPYSSTGHTVVICSNGMTVPVDISVSPIKDVNGKAIGVAFVFRDVSDTRKAETALRESEANLARAQEIAHIGDWEWISKPVRCAGPAQYGISWALRARSVLHRYSSRASCPRTVTMLSSSTGTYRMTGNSPASISVLPVRTAPSDTCMTKRNSSAASPARWSKCSALSRTSPTVSSQRKR